MCNDYEQQIRWAEYDEPMKALQLGTFTERAASDRPQADHVRIGGLGPVVRASGNTVELAPMRMPLTRTSGRPLGEAILLLNTGNRA
jgi:hypothetical protein